MDAISFVLVFTMLAFVYLLPSVVAAIRNVPDFGLILTINILLGGTGIGWLIALYMATRDVPPRSA